MKRKVVIGIIFVLLTTLISSCARVSQEEFDAVIADKDAALAELTSLQSQLATAQSNLNAAESEKDSIQTEVTLLQNQVSDVQSSLTNTNAEIAAKKAQIAGLEAKITALEKEVADLIKAAAEMGEGGEEQQETMQAEKPQRGGVAIISLASDVPGFDEVFIQNYSATTLHLTNEEMLQGDWTKGPAGTSEFDFILSGINTMTNKTGALADSWEIPKRGKIVFHIREGVHWHNKPPTNGRELTVDDVVYSFQRMCNTPGAYIKITYPVLANCVKITGDEAARSVTVDATACPSSEWASVTSIFPDSLSIMPKDAIEYYGNLNNWKNSIGTGPFIMTDYVSNSSITFIHNDNYWMTNPIGPSKGDQLPYIEGAKLLIIADTATATAAFRNKKIDSISGEYYDIKEFLDNPDVNYVSYTAESCGAIFMRTDKTNLPFSKKEVRQALMLATDFEKIRDDFYGGKATILGWPIAYVKEYKDAYVPMENLPASTQELFSHNVTKAKELIKSAGYPTGFDVTVTFYNTATTTDYLSLISRMWDDAGITLNLDGRDYTTWVARIRARNYDEMIYYNSSSNWQKMQSFSGTSSWNQSYVNDPRINEELAVALDLIGYDEVQLAKNFSELVPYIIEQCWVIPKPNPYMYVVWWTWVNNWNGELNIGYYNSPSYLKYIWMNEALKQ
jgi:peptide/nickel transport system substrate-binding protein